MKAVGPWHQDRWDLPPRAIGAEGSGGKQSSDPRLCRCGWGVVINTLESRGKQILGNGGLNCKQTVPGGELAALMDRLENIG